MDGGYIDESKSDSEEKIMKNKILRVRELSGSKQEGFKCKMEGEELGEH